MTWFRITNESHDNDSDNDRNQRICHVHGEPEHERKRDHSQNQKGPSPLSGDGKGPLPFFMSEDAVSRPRINQRDQHDGQSERANYAKHNLVAVGPTHFCRFLSGASASALARRPPPKCSAQKRRPDRSMLPRSSCSATRTGSVQGNP
jgi:hypothetical protein